MKQSVIVTGGAGFIGSHTCKRLAQQGFHPVVLDNLTTGHKDSVRWGPLVEGDIRNRSLVSATLEIYKPEAVIHFAGSAYVGESGLKPENIISIMWLVVFNCLNAALRPVLKISYFRAVAPHTEFLKNCQLTRSANNIRPTHTAARS